MPIGQPIFIKEEEYWEIDVPYHDNIYWSIVLCHFMQRFQLAKEDFKKDLEKIISDDVSDWKKITDCIKSYNPFLNRYSCFHNKNLISFIKKFKKILTQLDSAANSKKNTLDSLLLVVSNLLKCKIRLHYKNAVDVEKFGSFTTYCCNDSSDENPDIVLYGYSTNSINWKRLTILLPSSISEILQKKALQRIIRNMGMKSEVAEVILSLPGARDNLLKALLTDEDQQKECLEAAKRFLQQPPYIILKISEAGFEIDPLSSKDTESNSLFHHALFAKDHKLLPLLYNYLIDSSIWSESSIRLPDATIVDRLRQLGDILNNVKSMISSESDDFPQVRIEELIQFHKFQFNVCNKLYEKGYENNSNSKFSNDIDIAEDYKDIITSIVQEYVQHFNMDLENCKDNDEKEMAIKKFEMYRKYNRYYRYLDFWAALHFYDHSFALKAKFKFEGDYYSRFETSFARFIMLKSFYYSEFFLQNRPSTSTDTSDSSANLPFKKSHPPLRWNDGFLKKLLSILSYLERIKLEDELVKFTDLLNSTNIKEESLSKSLDRSLIHTLTEEPILKDYIISTRLQHYFNNALKDIDDNENVAVFAILRCLQVIGESITLEITEKPTVLKSLLISAFSESETSDFHNIRNHLSHISSDLSLRMECENDKFFFKEIQKELWNVKKNISYIFEFTDLRMKIFSLENGKNNIGCWNAQLEKPNYLALAESFEKINEEVEDINDNKTMPTKDCDYNLGEKKKNHLRKFLGKSVQCLSHHLVKIKRQMKTLILDNFEKFDKHFENLFAYVDKKDDLFKKIGKQKKNSNQFSIKNCEIDVKTGDSLVNDELGKSNPKTNLFCAENALCVDKTRNEFHEIGSEKVHDIFHSKKGEQSLSLKEEQKTCAKQKKLEEIKDEEIKWINSRLLAINQLLMFLTKDAELHIHKRKGLACEISNLKERTYANEIIEEYSELQGKIFTAVKSSNKIKASGVSTSSESDSNIHKLRTIITGKYFPSSQTKQLILSSVPEKDNNHHLALQDLLSLVRADGTPSDTEINKLTEFKSSKISKVKKIIKKGEVDKLQNVMKADLVEILKESLIKSEMKKGDFEKICRKFSFSEDIVELLDRITLGHEKRIEEKKIEFLHSRIIKLKELLIESSRFINYLWRASKSSNTRSYATSLIVKNYLRYPLLQAAVEQLLSDCIGVLNHRGSDWEKLWIKTNNLFNGINLRNLLEHINPLVVGVGHLLDSTDFPKEIISKILELISDIDAIDELRQLREKRSITFDELMIKMDEDIDEDDEFQEERKRIKSCENWQRYARLLPKKRYERLPAKELTVKNEIEEDAIDEEDKLKLSSF